MASLGFNGRLHLRLSLRIRHSIIQKSVTEISVEIKSLQCLTLVQMTFSEGPPVPVHTNLWVGMKWFSKLDLQISPKLNQQLSTP